jgi:hypothetical protein
MSHFIGWILGTGFVLFIRVFIFTVILGMAVICKFSLAFIYCIFFLSSNTVKYLFQENTTKEKATTVPDAAEREEGGEKTDAVEKKGGEEGNASADDPVDL